MATDYENIYREQRHALGAPARVFITFFAKLQPPKRVLDVGCGQGRDALFIGRMGHHVVGVDLSAAGITQLLEDAARENLNIKGIAADVLDHEPDGLFDIVLFDRTLHMLKPADQLQVIKRYMEHVARDGFVLINDERKNLPAIERLFLEENAHWQIEKKSKGLLFFQKTL